MDKTDFTKTSEQIEREVTTLIDKIEKSLENSTNEFEKKGRLAFAIALSAVVFFGILGFESIVGHPKSAPQSEAGPTEGKIRAKDLALVEENLKRIEDNINEIRATQREVAPSMQIDGNLKTIVNSTNDIRRVLAPGGESSTTQDPLPSK